MSKPTPLSTPLQELRKDLLTLSEADLLAKVREIRDDRKITKAPPKSVKKKADTANKLDKFMANLTPEQIKFFLEKVK